MANSIEDVLNQMRERGIEPTSNLSTDGKKVTWAGDVRRPKKKNAWAVLHEWTSPKSHRVYIVGIYGIRDQYWTIEPTQVEWSPAEKVAWQEKQRKIEKDAEEDRKALAAAAVEKATKLWERARLEGASEYLERKQVGAYGVRFAFGSVVIPLVDLAGNLHGLQWIAKDGGKVFGTGTVKEAHFHLLGDMGDELPVAFAEGYATAASVHMATGWPVVTCFDAGNLMPVIAAWRKLYPDKRFLIAADDDRHLVRRLCERLELFGVTVSPASFAKSAGGVRDMRFELDEGRVIDLKAHWSKDKADVYYIEGSITADGVAQILRLENAGRAKAFAAAKRYDAQVVLPHFATRAGDATDFNDLHVAEGLAVVREQLLVPRAEPERKKSIPPPPGAGGPGGGSGDGTPNLRFPYVTDKFEIRGIRENVYYALRNDPALHQLVRYNEFANRIDKCRVPPWGGKIGEWSETLDDIRLAEYLASRYELIIGNPVTIEQAILMSAHDNTYNPVRDDFECVEWDGVERRKHWLIDCMGAEDTPYVRAVSEYFIVSMAARVFDPGCQMDYMLVLQGLQGERKTSVLRVLGGEYYGSGSFRVGDKEGQHALQGNLLFNFNELDGMSKAESTGLKGFITERTDKIRLPYARNFKSFPRNCVLSGDTNQDEFLRDATGDRRYWVVHCSEVNVERMVAMRSQLLAEALHHYRAGTRRYPDKEEERRLFQPEQEKWKFTDVWEDWLSKYVQSTEMVEGYDGTTSDMGTQLENRERTFFGTPELLARALHIDIGKVDGAGSMQKRVAAAMKRLGFIKYRWPKGRIRPNGYQRSLDVANVATEALVAPPAASTTEVPEWE